MTRLTQHDLRALVDAVGLVHAHPDVESFPRGVLAAVRRVVAADLIAYTDIDLRDRRVRRASDPPDVDVPDSEQIFLRHAHEHPVVARYQHARGGGPLKVSDFLTRREFHRLGIYAELYRQLGTEYQITVLLPDSGPHIRAVVLSRTSRDFDERDRRVLDLLRPHLARGHATAEVVSRLKGHLALFSRGLDTSGPGLVALSMQGRVRFANARARRYMGEYFDDGPRRADRLPEVLQRWVLEAHAGPGRTGPRLVASRGTRDLVAWLVVEPAGRLIVLDEQRRRPEQAALERYGLSRREAEVLTWVAEGKTSEIIARILGISPRTVHKHLEHIYRKLGVESRTAAASLAWSEPPER